MKKSPCKCEGTLHIVKLCIMPSRVQTMNICHDSIFHASAWLDLKKTCRVEI